jgi:hypothetical protein
LNPQQASTIIDVLSAFPSFKKPKENRWVGVYVGTGLEQASKCQQQRQN